MKRSRWVFSEKTQAEHVGDDEDDRDGEREVLDGAAVVDRLGAGLRQALALDQLEDRRHHQRRRGQHQHRALDRGAGAAEGLLLAADPAGQHRRPHDEQDVADDRADDRGLDHLLQPLAEGEEGDDQLRRVAEGDVEEAADPRPRAGRQLLGRPPHQRRGGDDPERRGGEDDDRRDAEQVERDRDRDQRRQQVGVALRRAQEGGVEAGPVGGGAWLGGDGSRRPSVRRASG